MKRSNDVLMALLVAGLCLLPVPGSAADDLDPAQILQHRPGRNQLVVDYADILSDARDYGDQYLGVIRADYGIEAVIVSVPSLRRQYGIQEFAVELFDRWGIGRDSAGRGLLLLLVEDTQQVKLEVASELEDVFTDAFTGYVEDKQLRPYFAAGQVGTGLLAVMEEIEQRARLRHQGEYTADQVRQLDALTFLSQGGGGGRDMKKFRPETVIDSNGAYPAGATPEAAWQTIIASYRDKVRDPNLGVYTPLTRLAYADYTNLPDTHYNEEFTKYRDKDYEVISDGDFAVIFFGKQDGWDNAPFLLHRSDEGWQFDIVHQRKYVRMGRNPKWGIERADYPYIDLLNRCPYFEGQDIPLTGEDRFDPADDGRWAAEITALQGRVAADPQDAAAWLELGRAATITSHSRQRLQWLQKARQLNPDRAEPYKYLAISHVDMFYQYQQALPLMQEYVRRVPEDIFGHNFLGYLYLQTGEDGRAVDAFKKALAIDGDNLYAQCKLARAYAGLYNQAVALDPRKGSYKDAARQAYARARELAPDHRRVAWTGWWLSDHGVR